jgi:SNF2 family DNA or RNA helicase
MPKGHSLSEILMALLHGSWIHTSAISSDPMDAHERPSTFFLWGEVWRSTAPAAASVGSDTDTPFTVPAHPFGMDKAELSEFLNQLVQAKTLTLPDGLKQALHSESRQRSKPSDAKTSEQWKEVCLGGLSRCNETEIVPLHSATVLTPEDEACLFPVQVSGLCLDATIATEFLLSLPLGTGLGESQESWLGSDLVFWSHVTRWSLDLLVRSKFLPAIAPSSDHLHAYWQPLLDSAIDQARFRQFKDQMPLVCRCYQIESHAAPALAQPPEAAPFLLMSLQQLVDRQVRQRLQGDETLMALKTIRSSSLSEWLIALSASGVSKKQWALSSDTSALVTAYKTWTEPIESALSQNQLFRAAFQLAPPLPRSRDWTVTYGLQATDDPSCWVSADSIWMTTADKLTVRRRILEHPQEMLLAGLGLASRVYPAIEESLQNARPSQHTLTPMQAYDFLKAVAWRLEDNGFGVIVPPTLSNREGWANRLGLQIRAEVPSAGRPTAITLNSLLDFKWELTIGGQRLSKGEFDYLVSQDSPLVEINGEWVELRTQDIRAAQTFFANRQNQAGLTLQDALRLSTGDVFTIEKLPVVKFEATGALEELLSTLSGNQSFEPVEPKNFQGTLRPYQARGVGWLTFLERWNLGACLADDMGLGKTIQLIGFLLHLKAQKRWKDPMLLICPTSVLGNWEREIKRFAPKLKVLMHHGPGRPQGKNFAQAVAEYDVVLTSYALVHRDEAFLTRVDWQGIVLDEAQNIKNPEARQSQTVRRLQAKCRIALTGTPLENRLLELWSILDFLNPGYLGSRAFFQKRFATPIERYGDSASLQTLRSLAQPFILRRTKTDRDIIQDLPDKQETTVFCNLTSEQAALYEKTVQDSLAAVESAEGIQRHGIILATLTKLKQICNHPAQFLKESALRGALQRSGKLKRLEEILEEALAEGDRALIFTQFAEMGKLLQGYLREDLKRETLLLYGGTSKTQREAMIDRFQNDPQGPRLFILSLKAGGVGLNLTRANHVFHFDRWWNPAVENQATDRVFRIGQTRNVQVHKFVCSGTLEERIHEMIESKKALADQVIGAGENWLTEMNTDQLRQLLLLDRTAVVDEDL